jgi:hypothetical protein
MRNIPQNLADSGLAFDPGPGGPLVNGNVIYITFLI